MTFFGKVSYYSKEGYMRDAYLDYPVDGTEIYPGTEKHTDAEIRVTWSDNANEWIEI